MSEEIIDVTSNETGAVSPEGKSRAIVAHITWIGWIIALIQNGGDKKDEFASFYIRQMLGLLILNFLAAIPILGIIILIANFVFWIMSISAASKGVKKPTPIVGEMFQNWFKNL